MSRTEKRAEVRFNRQYLTAENKKWPAALKPVHPDDWPKQRLDARQVMIALYRSRDFVCQVYAERAHPAIVARLSIHRTMIDDDGGWVQGIAWDDLQRLKREAGYGALDAVEVYPEDSKVVNVANMRHLWVMNEPLSFKWGAE